MRRLLVALAALLTLAASVAATAPASLAGAALERASDGRLSLANAEGTLWRGHGTLAAARALRIPLAWAIDPWPLVRGELRVAIVPATATARSPRAEIIASGNAVTVRELDATLPAEFVTALAPRSPVRASGDLRISAPSLAWTPATLAGGVRIDWQDASFAVANEAGIRLGTVTALLAAAADRLSGPVTNEGGEFGVRGTLSIDARGAPNASLTLVPRRGDPTQSRTLSLSTDANGNLQLGPGAR